MTLYKQLQNDPTLRVQSLVFGISIKGGITLRNENDEYPILVEFNSGRHTYFTVDGFNGKNPNEDYDIKIHKP